MCVYVVYIFYKYEFLPYLPKDQFLLYKAKYVLKRAYPEFFVDHMCHDTLFDKKNTQKYWLEI